MSELHSFVNDVSDFFAELDNHFQMRDGYLLNNVHHVYLLCFSYRHHTQLTFSP